MRSPRGLVPIALLLACGKPADPREHRGGDKPAAADTKPVDHGRQTLAGAKMQVPLGWTATYDAERDVWRFASPPLLDGRTTSAVLERANPTWVASPDAYLAQLRKHWDAGTKADFESRRGVKDGFAMTIVVTPARSSDAPARETFVVRQLGNVWYQCSSEWVTDDAMRDQLLALCTSVKL
jgi:hypothetical protein